jgi:hypothetical protein
VSLTAEQSAKLAQLVAAREKLYAEREAKMAEQALDHEERLAKFESEVGEHGRMFEWIDARDLGAGFIYVKRPEAVQHKRFLGAVDKANTAKRPLDEADVAQYVTPNVLHPTREAYLTIASECPEIGNRCARAMMDLAGTRKADAGSKY